MIAIDSEFQSLIPPLSEDEYERLEKSILAEGIREPIITWNGTIIDGHNRYHICEEHGIKCPQVERKFESRDAAKLFIIDNQLRRRNLPPAAIGLLKLEEKEIVARRAESIRLANLKRGDTKPDTPNLGERENRHDGETLEQLAKDIPLGRESLRKLDVIKRKAEEGDETAIEARAALQSGEKKSIHGAYVAVVGKPKQRKSEETVTEDGRRICVMCGEPIDEGEANPARPTVHKKCEQEYQHDWERSKKLKVTDDGRRICTVCGKPIDDGDSYESRPSMHKSCWNMRNSQHRYANPDISLLNNVAIYTVDSLLMELQASADNLKEAWSESIIINESMGVELTKTQKKKLDRAVVNLFRTIQKIKEESDSD